MARVAEPFGRKKKRYPELWRNYVNCIQVSVATVAENYRLKSVQAPDVYAVANVVQLFVRE